MLDLLAIRNSVEEAFTGFDFTNKVMCITSKVNGIYRALSVILHDVSADMYVNYTISTRADNNTITVIGPDGEVVNTQHTSEEVIKAMSENMKEWGVEYANNI